MSKNRKQRQADAQKKDKTKSKPKDEWKFPVELPSKQTVIVTVKHTLESIDRKIKYESGIRVMSNTWSMPTLKTLRDKDGKPVTAPVQVRGMRVTIEFPDGKSLTARSCCKLPDVFRPREGKVKALNRLWQLDSGVDVRTGKPSTMAKSKPRLSGLDRKELFYAVLTNGRKRPADKIKKVPQPVGETQSDNLAVG